MGLFFVYDYYSLCILLRLRSQNPRRYSPKLRNLSIRLSLKVTPQIRLTLSPFRIFFAILMLHNAARVGTNPMRRTDTLHAYMLIRLHVHMLICLQADIHVNMLDAHLLTRCYTC